MMLRSIFVALVAAAAVALPASAADTAPRLIEAGGAQFPDRSYILAVDADRQVKPGEVTVLENGDAVSSFSLTPADAAGGRYFAAVLAIDASNSMRGEPIERAMEAARAFAARRNPAQRLGVVFFNEGAAVALRPTANAAVIDEALRRTPILAEGTKMYDGVGAAVDVLTRARISSGIVVVLSDGADVGSTVDRDDVVAAANEKHVRVFTVGLRSDAYDSDALVRLASETGGLYTEAVGAEDLTRIFDELGYKLANEYLIRYRSLAGPNAKVNVEVTVAGVPGAGVSGYTTPALPLPSTPPYRRPLLERMMLSPAAMVVVSIWAAAIFAAGAIAVFRPRRGTLLARMSAFVSLPQANADVVRPKSSPLAERLTAGTEKSLDKTRWWGRFKAELEIAEVKVPATQIVLWTLIATFVLAWLLPTIIGTPVAIVFAFGVPIAVRSFLKRKLVRKRRLFAEQLPDNLEVLASALRAGHSLVGALTTVIDDSAEPSRSEFRRVVADEQLGVPLEDALRVVVERMDNRDLEQVALVAALQREAGSNSAEVLDTVTENVRGRQEVRRLVRTLTAQGRLSRWVVSLLPVGLLCFITLVNFSYVEPLFTHPGGRAMLIVAAVMVVAGSLVIKKIVDIKV